MSADRTRTRLTKSGQPVMGRVTDKPTPIVLTMPKRTLRMRLSDLRSWIEWHTVDRCTEDGRTFRRRQRTARRRGGSQ